jgi:16S rRNA (cytidine1402-2'-O)-methyltransferase
MKFKYRNGGADVTAGTLFVVSTPIGNMEDITLRARRVLQEVDLIAAEDTRHSGRLLEQLMITTPMVALHDHNEKQFAPSLVQSILDGSSVALISDAGTPLLSDPGYALIDLAIGSSVKVVPVVGASAILAALSVAGMPTDRFTFEGFLPAKQQARQNKLRLLTSEPRTMVFFEAPHRIRECIADMHLVFGGERLVTIGRELTKVYEQVVRATLDELRASIEAGEIPAKGEFVLVVKGAELVEVATDTMRLLNLLLKELPPAKAAGIAHKLTGQSKKALYKLTLEMKNTLTEK